MTPYVQREIFRQFEQVLLNRAVRAVSLLDASWGNELRCHELARAVHQLLDANGLSVVDGKLGSVEHTWLELIVPMGEMERRTPAFKRRAIPDSPGYMRKVILDVYTPGRLPQVQLIDPFALLDPVYKVGGTRTDIDDVIVQRAYREMYENWISSNRGNPP